MVNTLKKTLFVTILFGGVVFSLLSFGVFNSINVYKIKSEKGKIEKFYIINQEYAENIIKNSNIYVDKDDENFDIIQFFERLNGDFKLKICNFCALTSYFCIFVGLECYK